MFVAIYAAEWGMMHPSVDMPEWIAIAEYFFLGFFSIELLFIKLMVHAPYFVTNSDWPWSWFDARIVGMAVLELMLLRYVYSGVDLTWARICRLPRLDSEELRF